MAYPTEQRLKILQQQYSDAQVIAAPAPSQRPQAIPGLVIDFIPRTDTGYCLKVIPLAPITTTSAGELAFIDGTGSIPANADQRYYFKVFPVDILPANVESAFAVGDPVNVFPFWGPNDSVRGSFICFSGGDGIPKGEFQGMCFMNVTQNQMGSSYPFAHELI